MTEMTVALPAETLLALLFLLVSLASELDIERGPETAHKVSHLLHDT